MRKMKKNTAQRMSMLRSMTTDIIMHGQVVTTMAKAKDLKSFVEKIITRAARSGGIASRRLVSKEISSKEAVGTLFRDIGPKYSARPGGYTRIIKLGRRRGDGAETCRIELV